MDLDYLKALYSDHHKVFGQTHATYEALESKARYIATGLSAILVGFAGYVIEKGETFSAWQYAFVTAAFLALAISVYNILLCLFSKEYLDGVSPVGPIEGGNLSGYYNHMSSMIEKALETNEAVNKKKAEQLNYSLSMLLAVPFFGFTASVLSLFSADKSAGVNDAAGVGIASGIVAFLFGIVIFGVVHHVYLYIKERIESRI